jgi:crotonobetainyl-CoA:carnitine CoA-transferase CaiB-like acyl-CoA transferase
VVASQPYVEARLSEQFDHPTAGAITMPRSPLTAGASSEAGNRPPPLLGEHTQEVLSALGSRGEATPLVACAAASSAMNQD